MRNCFTLSSELTKIDLKWSDKKSLPKETFRKAIDGEGHGAVAGNASAKNLNRNGSERLNRFALTQSYSAAKLQQNTETTKKKVQNRWACQSSWWKWIRWQLGDCRGKRIQLLRYSLRRFFFIFLFVSDLFLTFAFEHCHDVRVRSAVRHCWKYITSVCCYSELLQEPEKFKKSSPKE